MVRGAIWKVRIAMVRHYHRQSASEVVTFTDLYLSYHSLCSRYGVVPSVQLLVGVGEERLDDNR